MEIRRSVLEEAIGLITGDRNAQYGPPTQDFDRIAEMWTTYFRGAGLLKPDAQVRSHDVAVAQILLKVSRLCHSPGKRDHWVDIGGYAGCGAECVLGEA